jgi:Na+/pantothenate symporter
LAILAAGIALDPPGDILQLTIFSGSLYAVCFLPAVVLGLYWDKGSANAVLLSMTSGTITLLFWLAAGFNALVHEVFPALIISAAVYSLIAQRSDQRVDLQRLVGLN